MREREQVTVQENTELLLRERGRGGPTGPFPTVKNQQIAYCIEHNRMKLTTLVERLKNKP